MRRPKGDFPFLGWRRFLHLLLAAVLLCVVSISFELPQLLKSNLVPISSTSHPSLTRTSTSRSNNQAAVESSRLQDSNNRIRLSKDNHGRNILTHYISRSRQSWKHSSERSSAKGYGRIPKHIKASRNGTWMMSELDKMAEKAWQSGAQLWSDLHRNASSSRGANGSHLKAKEDACPHSIFLSQEDLQNKGNVALLPCGLMLGSSITVVGTPLPAHLEQLPKTYRIKGHPTTAMVSQFIVELQGLKVVDNEDPPRILHVNPRLRGDWSGKAIFEVNTCYRGQWGVAQRCNGMESHFEDETVDGLLRCEKWATDDDKTNKEAKSTSWLDKIIGFSGKPNVYWRYPFVENQSFVLTIRAGWEGYHMSVDGRHIASSPYRTGFSLEDATGLAVNGDIELHSVLATSLPTIHPTHAAALEMHEKLRVPQPTQRFDFFIGILSAANHFAERMAIRKTWMQSTMIQTSEVVAKFFVALHANTDVNVMLKKEAEYYGDIIIVPFLDRYELLVLKTVAICEYAVYNTSAQFIMKCDDDNFVRVETVIKEVKATGHEHGLYMGNINLDHRPLRIGKWAVTFEEWPEEEYPPYANGPGYIITRDIADFIVSQHTNHLLRLFKMEDVSIGMWVVQYNLLNEVHYQHSFKFCQFGCVEDYYTAHYQSPRHMFCMWEKLSEGRAECCNMR